MAPYRLFKDVLAGTPALLREPGTYALRAGMMIRKETPQVIHLTPQEPLVGTVKLVVWFYFFLFICTLGSPFLYPQIGRRAIVVLYGIVVMNWVCYSVVFWSKPRFRYTTEVALCILAGIVVWRLWDAVRLKVMSARLEPPGE